MDLSHIPQQQDDQDWCDLAECIHLLQQPSNTQLSPKLIAARNLKLRVIHILENYSSLLADQQKANHIHHQMSLDYQQVHAQYQHFLSIQGQYDNEISKIDVLVLQFLKLFSQKQQSHQDSFTIKDPQKMLKQLELKIQDRITKIETNTQFTQSAEWAKIKTIVQDINQGNYLKCDFKQLRHLSKLLDDKDIKKIVKYCYLKLRLCEGEKSESTRVPSPSDDKKKRFFD